MIGTPVMKELKSSKLKIKTPERRHHVILVFLLFTLNIFHTFFDVSIVDFEQVNIS